MSIAPSVPDTARPRRAATAAWIGTSIEYYDFFLYGTASALVFGRVFFPNVSPLAGTLAALATYSVAFFARPLGGVIFGYMGDRIGRKRNLVITLVMMGAATFLVGCLPGYDSIGVVAPISLVVLRFAQGLAVGGEWGGGVLMSVEHAPDGRKGFYGTFVQLGSPTGSLLASLAFYLVSTTGDSTFTTNAWRVPFLASAALIVVGLYIRLRLPESPEFAEVKRTGSISPQPLRELLSEHRARLFTSIGALILGTGGFYVVAVYLLLVYAPAIGVSQSTALLAGIVLNLASMATFSLYGRLGDRYGARRVSMIGCVYTIVLAFPMFALVSTGSTILVLLAVPLCYAGSNAVFALNSSLVSMVFPTRIRYTGISVSFQVAAVLSAAPAPFLATWLQSLAGGASWPVVCYLILLATVSLACIARLRPYQAPNQSHRPTAPTQADPISA